MKTSVLAACALAALTLAGCVTDAPRTSLRPGPYDPEARVRDADMDDDAPVVVPYGFYGGYGYPGAYYYGGSVGYGYYGYPYGFGYGYGMPGPVIIPPRHHHRPPPATPPSRPSDHRPPNVPRPPVNPPRTFRDLFPGARR